MVSTRFIVAATVAALAGCSAVAPSATSPETLPERQVQALPQTVRLTAQDLEAIQKMLPQQLTADQAQKLIKIEPSKIRVPERTTQVVRRFGGFHRFGGFGGFGRFGWGGFGRFGWGGFGLGGPGLGIGSIGWWPFGYGGYNLLYPYGLYGGLYSPLGYNPWGWAGGYLSPYVI